MRSTMTLIMYLNKHLFSKNYGMGGALSVFLFVITGLLSLIVFRFNQTKKTRPVLIAQLRSADFLKFDMGQVYVMIAFSIFPVIIVYILLSRFIVSGVALGGVKG